MSCAGIASQTAIVPGVGDLTFRGLDYQGAWDASTNTPTLQSSIGIKNHYYIVSVAGNTSLDGISVWYIGDWVVFNGSVWQKFDFSDLVTSVFTRTGAITAQSGDYDADQVDYDGATSGLSSGNVQGAIDESYSEAIKHLFSKGANEAIFLSPNPPAGRNRSGHAVIDFDDTTDESIQFLLEMPAHYNDEDFKIIIPTAARNAQALPKNVGWQVEIERLEAAATGLDTPSFAAAQQITVACPANDEVVYASITLTQAQADGVQASERFRLRLTRYNTGVSDNVVLDAELVDGIAGEIV